MLFVVSQGLNFFYLWFKLVEMFIIFKKNGGSLESVSKINNLKNIVFIFVYKFNFKN